MGAMRSLIGRRVPVLTTISALKRISTTAVISLRAEEHPSSPVAVRAQTAAGFRDGQFRFRTTIGDGSPQSSPCRTARSSRPISMACARFGEIRPR